MNYGFHLATGGALGAMRRMDVIANNLANASTVGFKSDFIVARERPAERVEGLSNLSDPLAPPQEMLEKLGGGIRFDPDRIDLHQGTLERTGNATDLALNGDGYFVAAPAPGAPNNAPTEVTRAGNLTIDPDGTFRLIGSGRALLGEDGRAVKIDPTRSFNVDATGGVYQDGSEVARFRIVRPKDDASLVKASGNLLRANGPLDRVNDGSCEVAQFSLEESGVDPVLSMVELLRQSRLLESNLRVIQYQDSMTGQAIAGMTRIA